MAQINIAEIRPSGTIEGKVDALYDAYFMMRKQMMYYLSGALDSENIQSITTDRLIAGTAKIGTALIEDLEVGRNVTMGPDATISWGKVTGTPYIPSTADITQITADYVSTPNLYTNIAKVNNHLSLGGGYKTTSSLSFDGIGGIDASNDVMRFSAMAGIVFSTYTSFGASVSGLENSGYAKTSDIAQAIAAHIASYHSA